MSNFVAPKKVTGKVAELLNAKLEAGEDIVLGAVGQATNKTYQDNPTVAVDGFLTTSKGASYLHEIDRSKFNLRFPLPPGIMFGEESDERIQQSFAERFGAPDMEALHADPERYQTPVAGEGGGKLQADGTHRWWSSPDDFWTYGQHEKVAVDGLKAGFGTESRKFEVYAQMLVQLAKTGFPCCYPRAQVDVDPSIGQGDYEGTYAPICQHIEPAESPLEGTEGYDAEYPLTLTSGRVYYTHHGTQRQAPYMREIWPAPDLRMNSKTAERYGLAHMDWVKVTSRRGSTHARVYITDGMHENVVWMERFLESRVLRLVAGDEERRLAGVQREHPDQEHRAVQRVLRLLHQPRLLREGGEGREAGARVGGAGGVPAAHVHEQEPVRRRASVRRDDERPRGQLDAGGHVRRSAHVYQRDFQELGGAPWQDELW